MALNLVPVGMHKLSAVARGHLTRLVARSTFLACFSAAAGPAMTQPLPEYKRWNAVPSISVTIHSNIPSFSRLHWEREFADVSKSDSRLSIQILGHGQQARTASHVVIDAYDKPDDSADSPYPQTLADVFRDVAQDANAAPDSGVTYDLGLVPWGVAVYKIASGTVAKSWIWIHHPLSTIIQIRATYSSQKLWKISDKFISPRELNEIASMSQGRDLTTARKRRDALLPDPKDFFSDLEGFSRTIHPTHLAPRIALAALGTFSLRIVSGVESPETIPAALRGFLQNTGMRGPSQLERYLFATFGVGSSLCVEREKQVFADNQFGAGNAAEIRIQSLPWFVTTRPTTCGGNWYIDLSSLL